jgi:hypothetical protein
VTETYRYDVNGNLTETVTDAGSAVYEYSDANLVTGVTKRSLDGAVQSYYRYEYRLDGNQTLKEDGTGKVT